MKDTFQLAEQDLLQSSGIGERELCRLMGELATHQVDYADLYFQSTYSESWALEEGIIKGGSFDIDRGVGVRAISGEKTGFAYADDILFPALQQAVQAANSIVKHGGQHPARAFQKKPGHRLYEPVNPIYSVSENDKVALLQRIDQYIRKKEPRVIQVSVGLAAEYDTVLIIDSEGNQAADIRPLVRLSITLILESRGKRETGHSGGGGRFDYQQFLLGDLWMTFADEAIEQARLNLDAVEAPAGMMPVVLGSGWPGVLLHEAVGHGLEGDFNRKGISVYSNRIGEKVANSICTIVDNGTLPNRRGSLNIDDEGVPTQNNVLIEKGILKQYLLDKKNARLMRQSSTGNGRRLL